MKLAKLLLLNMLLFSLYTRAVIHHIGVDGCSFNPPVMNSVRVGDTIHWFLDSPTMRRTSSLNIPPGAAAWDALLDNDKKDFYYVVSVKGQYFYRSNILPTCIASFNVTEPVGLNEPFTISVPCSFFPNPAHSTFLLIHPKDLETAQLFDTNGKLVMETPLDPKETNDEIDVRNLKAGNYTISVTKGGQSIYRSGIIIAD